LGGKTIIWRERTKRVFVFGVGIEMAVMIGIAVTLSFTKWCANIG
jgi:hypothetical protein